MQLEQTYRIKEVFASQDSGAEYRFLLDSTRIFIRRAGELIMDQAACERHNIAPSLDLVNRLIRCTLTSRTLNRTGEIGDGHTLTDTDDMSPDEMLLDCIRHEEEWIARYNCLRDALVQKVRYFLRAFSDNRGDGDSGVRLRGEAQFYKLTVELTKEEFRACTQFAPGTVLAARFELLPEEAQATTLVEEEKA